MKTQGILIMKFPILATIALLTCLGYNVVAASGQPNIVIILADDMYWHHPGFNGGPVSTPNLDRLASQGTSLTQFYVHSVCSPTRAALLTGRYPFRNGMEERSHGNDVAGMLLDERTLAEALKEAGYYTGIIGKWHLGNWFKDHLPMQRGFDYQYGLYGALISYYGKARGRFYDWHRNEQTIQQEGYSTDLIAEEFVKVLDEYASTKPFFFYVPFNATHGPDEAPVELVEKYRELVQKRLGKATLMRQQEFEAVKYAMLESMDSGIGHILESLRKKGVYQDTLIVFFNDNGGRKENPPYRGGKGQNYEGGTRVPCIIHWPGKVAGNKQVDEMTYVADLYPTLINLAGASLEQEFPIDGFDIWDVITRGKKSPRKEIVFSLPGDFVDTGDKAIRQNDYKLVGEELFNIAEDPYEKRNVAMEKPEVFQALNQRLTVLLSVRRTPEKHTKITEVIDQPLLVFGKEENSDPPAWLETYVKALPDPKK
jgi:arylsulfatase A-like enzyme